MIDCMFYVFTITKKFFKLFGKGIHRLYQIAKGVCDTKKNVKKAALIQIMKIPPLVIQDILPTKLP